MDRNNFDRIFMKAMFLFLIFVEKDMQNHHLIKNLAALWVAALIFEKLPAASKYSKEGFITLVTGY